jgi:Transglycosylase SLT domain
MDWKKLIVWAVLSVPLVLMALVVWVVALWLLLLPAPAHAQVPPAAHQYRAELTRAAHTQWGLDAPIPAFAAQIHQESGWRADAVSRVGAQGMAQFMPATASWWCSLNRLSAADCQPSNPTWALRSMVGFNRYLYDRTPKRYSERDRLWVALRGYNGGLGHWSAEAASTGLAQPTLAQVDAACGQARRHRTHCPENLGYPQRILNVLQPRYSGWGRVL